MVRAPAAPTRPPTHPSHGCRAGSSQTETNTRPAAARPNCTDSPVLTIATNPAQTAKTRVR